MTPLCALLNQYQGEWRPSSDTSKIDTKKEVFVEALSLLANLCEANQTALKIFNQNNLIRILFLHLDESKFGQEVVSSVLQCVYSVSENNPSAVEAVKETEAQFASLLTPEVPVDPSMLLVRVLACGVVFNVNRESALPVIMGTISAVLSQDQRKMINEYTSEVPLEGKQNGNAEKNTPEEQEKRLKLMESALQDVISGQQIALEILTNLCCDDADEEEWEEADLNSDMVSFPVPSPVENTVILHVFRATIM